MIARGIVRVAITIKAPDMSGRMPEDDRGIPGAAGYRCRNEVSLAQRERLATGDPSIAGTAAIPSAIAVVPARAL